ncbi:724_t:CDS:2, partial [Acaulospora morrowiae]
SLMAAVRNSDELIATRFLLGVAEAGFVPGILLLLSLWYKRSEYGTRFTIFISGNVLAGAFGGLLAYVIIGNMNGKANIQGWRWLFLLEGIVSFIVSLIALLIIPGFPEDEKFLTTKERQLLMSRLHPEHGTAGEQIRTVTIKHALFITLKDWRVYLMVLHNICINTALNSISLYLPTLIYKMGFDSLKTQLLTLPPYFFGWLFSLVVSLHSDHVQLRGHHIICCAIIGAIGFLMLANLKNAGMLYSATFLCTSGTWAAGAMTLAWIPNIFYHPREKRAIAIALILSAGIISVKGHMINASFLLIAAICAIIMRLVLKRKNEKMRQSEDEKKSTHKIPYIL